MSETAGLYIHIPFCRRKCVYCDFYSLSAVNLTDEYVKAVIRNIKAKEKRYDTVYFGGGTPTLLSAQQIYDILSAADIEKNAEITAEANPDSAVLSKLMGMRSAGVNRLSLGVQSFCGRELSALGRLHSCEQALSAFGNARRAGFENISLDLMLGIPYQTKKSLEKTLSQAAELYPDHISAYMLKIEEGTPLWEDRELQSNCADSDTLADMYLQTADTLEKYGYHQYEISNFCRSGYECRHNLKYWRCEDYIGIGAAAHSFADRKRFAVPADINRFINSGLQPEEITDDSPCSPAEKMMLRLRLTEGYPLSEAGEASGKLIRLCAPLEKAGFLSVEKGNIRLTPNGFLVSNEIICRLTCCFD